jgi:cytochrome P450
MILCKEVCSLILGMSRVSHLSNNWLILDEGGGFAFFPYGASWRRLRRIGKKKRKRGGTNQKLNAIIAHSGLVKNKIDIYQPILDDRRTILLSHLYKLSQENPKNGVSLSHFLEHYTMTSILAIAYGDMCNFEPGDPVLHKAFALTERAANTMGPADQIREFFPILKFFWPIQRDKYFKVRDEFGEFYGGLLMQFKGQEQQQQECFVKDIIQLNELTDLQLRNFIGIFVGAGSETTTSTLEWLIAFLANHPEIQDKAYKEIEEMIGLDRLPGSQDGM